MKKDFIPKVRMAVNATGAVCAAKQGDIVVIVDIIDMSTTLETCLEEGAINVYGASPLDSKAPVKLDPYLIAKKAAKEAREKKCSVIVVSEPRTGEEIKRESFARHIINTLDKEGIKVEKIVPNLGKEVADFADWRKKIVIAVTSSGGTAYDAAFLHGAEVCTATVARTKRSKGNIPAEKGFKRALFLSQKAKKNITVVAASSNSIEDVIATKYLVDFFQERLEYQAKVK